MIGPGSSSWFDLKCPVDAVKRGMCVMQNRPTLPCGKQPHVMGQTAGRAVKRCGEDSNGREKNRDHIPRSNRNMGPVVRPFAD